MQSYKVSMDRNVFPVITCLIRQEEFFMEARERIEDWLKKGPESYERKVLMQVLHKQLYLEDYDAIVSQCGNHSGEGWNGCYRIYNYDGNFATLCFRCNCYPGYNREDIKMTAKMKVEGSQSLNLMETVDNDDPIFNVQSLVILRKYLLLENVTLTLLFCFFLFSIGPPYFIFNFQALSSDAFSTFWDQLEAIDNANKI